MVAAINDAAYWQAHPYPKSCVTLANFKLIDKYDLHIFPPSFISLLPVACRCQALHEVNDNHLPFAPLVFKVGFLHSLLVPTTDKTTNHPLKCQAPVEQTQTSRPKALRTAKASGQLEMQGRP